MKRTLSDEEQGEEDSLSIDVGPAKKLLATYGNFSKIEHHKLQLQVKLLQIKIEQLQAQLTFKQMQQEEFAQTKESRILRLERDRESLLKEEWRLKCLLEYAQQDKADVVQEWASRLAKTEEKIRGLEEERNALREELQTSRLQVKREGTESTTKIGQLEAQVEGTQDQITNLQAQLNQRNESIRQLISQLAVLEEKSTSRLSAASSSPPINREGLLDRLHHLDVENRRLQHEHRLLMESSEHRHVLEEKLHTAEMRLGVYQKKEEQGTLVSEGQHQQTTRGELSSDEPPIHMRALLEKTAQFAQLRMQVDELHAKFQSLDAELLESRRRLEESHREKDRLSEELNGTQRKLLRAQGQEEILQSEIGMLRDHLTATEKLQKTNSDLIAALSSRLSSSSASPTKVV